MAIIEKDREEVQNNRQPMMNKITNSNQDYNSIKFNIQLNNQI